MAIQITWHLTEITRASGNATTWNTVAPSRAVEVWFGTQAEADATDTSRYDVVILDDNASGLVDAAEIRAALAASTATPDASNNAAFLGGYDVNYDGVPGTEPTLAYSTGKSGIEATTQAVLITLEPIAVTSFTAAYKGGVGNFDPFNPGTLRPPCFVSGTLIRTPDGDRAIEDLRAGDLIMTADRGPVPLRLMLSSRIDASSLALQPDLRPIRIGKGALGNDLPSSDLLVSPQHRVLIRSHIAQRMFGTNEVLVAAKQFLQIPGIDIASDLTDFHYFHMVFDRHEIVISNGAETESLYPGPVTLQSLSQAARLELLAVFPQIQDETALSSSAARMLTSGRMGRKLVVRHRTNQKPLVSS